jgi:hypothetical protein
MVYPALLPLMRTPRLPVVDWADAPADLNGLVRFAERRNLVSARVPSHFKRSLTSGKTNSWTFLNYVSYIRCHNRKGRSFKGSMSLYQISFSVSRMSTSVHKGSCELFVLTELEVRIVASKSVGYTAVWNTKFAICLYPLNSINTSLNNSFYVFKQQSMNSYLRLHVIQSECLRVISNHPSCTLTSHLHNSLNMEPIPGSHPTPYWRIFRSLPLTP